MDGNLLVPMLLRAALPAVTWSSGTEFWRRYIGMCADPSGQVFAPDEALRRQKLRRLLDHAYRTVPFYRDRFDAHHIHPESIDTFDDLRRLPPTTKQDIAANFPDRMTASGSDVRDWKYASTSGTVDRLTVIQDFHKRDIGRTTQLFTLSMATGYQAGMRYMEIPPDICRNICGSNAQMEIKLGRYLWEKLRNRSLLQRESLVDLRGLVESQVLYRRKVLPSFNADGLAQKATALDTYLQEIDNYRPAILKALPIYLYRLALHLQDTGARPPSVGLAIMPMGSSMTPHMRKVVESAFEKPVHEDYGCAELGAIATECGLRNGLHPLRNLFHVEVIRDDMAANPGQPGKVLITDFENFAMPLIRYDIGDVAVWRDDPCPCGAPGQRLEVRGRLQDCLTGSNGDILTPDEVTDALLSCPDLLAFKLERKADRILLNVIPHRPTFTDSVIRHRLHDLLGTQMPIQIRTVNSLQPEPGGKYRLVKNLVVHGETAGTRATSGSPSA